MRRLIIAAAVMLGGLTLTGTLFMVSNSAPKVPPVSARQVQDNRPYVIKLHARWCPVCMATRDIWAKVQATYAGRVKFVVFDFTSAATTAASRTEAERLGLAPVFDEYEGETGSVLIVNGTSRQVTQRLHGNRDLNDYNVAVDTVLQTLLNSARSTRYP
ncbi:MAG: thioredoxin family protein [Vicinamibacterales bacterium]